MPHFGMPRRVVESTVRSKAQINWRRGFFRVWLLLSGAWIMSWVLWLMIYGISTGSGTCMKSSRSPCCCSDRRSR